MRACVHACVEGFNVCRGATWKTLCMDGRKIKMRVRCYSCIDADSVAVNDPFSMAEDKNLAVEVDKDLKMMGYSKRNAVYLYSSAS